MSYLYCSWSLEVMAISYWWTPPLWIHLWPTYFSIKKITNICLTYTNAFSSLIFLILTEAECYMKRDVMWCVSAETQLLNNRRTWTPKNNRGFWLLKKINCGKRAVCSSCWCIIFLHGNWLSTGANQHLV